MTDSSTIEERQEAMKTVADHIMSLERQGDKTFCGESCRINHATKNGRPCIDCYDLKKPFFDTARQIRNTIEDNGYTIIITEE